MRSRFLPAAFALMAVAACAPREDSAMATPAAPVDFTGTEWEAFDIAGAAPVEKTRPSIRFGEDGRVSGAGSCNRFMGSWTRSADGLRLTFGQMASTMMACDPKVMAQEDRYLKLLGGGDRPYALRPDGTLVIGTPPDSVSFRRMPAEPAAR